MAEFVGHGLRPRGARSAADFVRVRTRAASCGPAEVDRLLRRHQPKARRASRTGSAQTSFPELVQIGWSKPTWRRWERRTESGASAATPERGERTRRRAARSWSPGAAGFIGSSRHWIDRLLREGLRGDAGSTTSTPPTRAPARRRTSATRTARRGDPSSIRGRHPRSGRSSAPARVETAAGTAVVPPGGAWRGCGPASSRPAAYERCERERGSAAVLGVCAAGRACPAWSSPPPPRSYGDTPRRAAQGPNDDPVEQPDLAVRR